MLGKKKTKSHRNVKVSNESFKLYRWNSKFEYNKTVQSMLLRNVYVTNSCEVNLLNSNKFKYFDWNSWHLLGLKLLKFAFIRMSMFWTSYSKRAQRESTAKYRNYYWFGAFGQEKFSLFFSLFFFFFLFFTYFVKRFQIQNGHSKSMIINWFLRICNHNYETFLQLNWQLNPIAFIQTVGHPLKAASGHFSKITIYEKIW